MTLFWSDLYKSFIRILTEDDLEFALCSNRGESLYKFKCRYSPGCSEYGSPNNKELLSYKYLLDKFNEYNIDYGTCPAEVNGLIELSLYGAVKYRYQKEDFL